MSERPPEEKALFDRVIKLLGASTAQTPATVEDVVALSDLDAALALCVVVVRDLDKLTSADGDVKFCGHCRDFDAATAETFDTVAEVRAHVAQCSHNPLVKRVRELESMLTPQQIEEWRHKP